MTASEVERSLQRCQYSDKEVLLQALHARELLVCQKDACEYEAMDIRNSREHNQGTLTREANEVGLGSDRSVSQCSLVTRYATEEAWTKVTQPI